MAWIDSPDVLKSTVERVREVRSLGMDVGVDFHGRLHKGMARQLAALLEKEGVLFIEGKSQTTGSRRLALTLLGHGGRRTSPSNVPIRVRGPRAFCLHPYCHRRTFVFKARL